MDEVQSSRIQGILAGMVRVLLPKRRTAEVGGFLTRHASTAATARRA